MWIWMTDVVAMAGIGSVDWEVQELEFLFKAF
jgi:hypothetical protein